MFHASIIIYFSDEKVGFIIPVEGKADQFLLGYGGDFALATWDGKSEKPQDVKVYIKAEDNPENRINDGKADPTGRVYAGEKDKFRKSF